MITPFHFDENPALYVSNKFSIYERYWNDVLEPEATDNWRMFNGWDEYIRRRRQEHRSSLQNPTLFPAVEGRVSQIMARLTSREPIMRFKAEDKSDPYEVLGALKVQQWIRDVLDRQNWLEEIALTMIAAEIFPICWVKCRLGELEMTPAEQRHLSETMGIPREALRKAKRTVPEFELLSPGSVYYDYRARDKRGVIDKFHVKQLSVDEIHTRFGPDIVKRVEDHESQEPSYMLDWEEAAGRKTYRERGEPRYRLAEGWISVQNSDGTVERRVVRFFPDVMREDAGDQPVGLMLENDEPPVNFDPFIPVTSRRLPFLLEGKSTVALGKAYQREAAELTNMAIDILGYSAAPPIVMQKGAVDSPNQLEFSARSLWMINEDFQPPAPLHVPVPNAPFLQAVRSQMQGDMDHVTAAYEGVTGQARQSGPQETLGAFRQRTAVGQGRLDLPLLGYAGVIAGIGERYLGYMHSYPRLILGQAPVHVQTPIGRQSVTLDDIDTAGRFIIANLTEFENNEIKKIELDRAIERSIAFPIVQMNPALMQVLLLMYWKDHITDPDTFQEMLEAMQQPLQPELVAPGGGANNQGMPHTQFSPGVGDLERSRGAVSAATAGGG